MILRRLTEHVRTQNWFAVALDFLIVVVGVFIGIQVSNWNAARLADAEREVLVERIAADFQRIKSDSQRSLECHQLAESDLRTFILALRSGELEEAEIPALERAPLFGLSFQTSADHSGTFTELLSPGRANLLGDSQLINALVDYEDFLERADQAVTFLTDMQLDVQGPVIRAFEFEFEADRSLVDDPYSGSTDFTRALNYDFESMAGDAQFINTIEQLVYAHSYFVLWRLRIDDRIDEILALIEEVSNASSTGSAQTSARTSG